MEKEVICDNQGVQVTVKGGRCMYPACPFNGDGGSEVSAPDLTILSCQALRANSEAGEAMARADFPEVMKRVNNLPIEESFFVDNM